MGIVISGLIRRLLCTTALCVVGACPALAQDTFDVFSYQKPRGFTKDTKSAMVSFTKTDKAAGTYVVIALFARVASDSDVRTEVLRDWQEIVVKQLGANVTPEVTTGERHGAWDTANASATFTHGNAQAMALLTTAKLGSHKVAILVTTNAKSLSPEVTSFVASLTLSGSNPPPLKAPTLPGAGPTPTARDPVAAALPSSLGIYQLAMPSYFTKEVKSNVLVFKEASAALVISIFPPQPSSGNLETDVGKCFGEMFAGWSTYSNNDANSIYTEKGTTGAGVSYVVEHRDLVRDDETIGGTVVVFGLGNNSIAVVTGRNERVWGALDYPGLEAIHAQYTYIIHQLVFDNIIAAPSKIDLSGTTWSAIGGSYVNRVHFDANGTYSEGSAASTSVRHSDTHDMVTTTSWSNDGKWALEGNTLTRQAKGSDTATSERARIVYIKNLAGTWEEKLGLFSVLGGRWGEVRYSRSRE